jgi:tRNA (guanine-N7-)-methyltransferase
VNTEEPSFITRKRKKWKFGHFNQWPNCFQADDVSPAKWHNFFGNTSSLTVEVGAGTADLTIGLAQRHPAEHFVAVDIKSDRLYTGAKFALQHQLKQIAFLRAPVTRIAEIFAPNSVKELWVTFPDPFPRKRQAKHRLTHPNFLGHYHKLLGNKGVLHFKTDNRDLFLWSLEQLVQQGWHITELSFDLHESSLQDEYKITTAYERRFIAEGIAINYCTATPPTA